MIVLVLTFMCKGTVGGMKIMKVFIYLKHRASVTTLAKQPENLMTRQFGLYFARRAPLVVTFGLPMINGWMDGLTH